MNAFSKTIGWAEAGAPFGFFPLGPLWRPRCTIDGVDGAPPAAQVVGMALDPAVLKARIDLRVCELKPLAAWTVVNCRGRVEREQVLRGLPPLPARRDEDDE